MAKTRKNRKSGSRKSRGRALSIPQMRAGMERVSSAAAAMSRSRMSHTAKVRAFQNEWQHTFGKKLSRKAASDYLKHARRMNTRRQRGGFATQGGGAVFSGAPLGYQMSQPDNLPNGVYPKYVSDGFTNPEPAMRNSQVFGLTPFANTGSNQVGGGFMDEVSKGWNNLVTGVNALSQRPYVAENPSSVIADASKAYNGQGLPVGPNSYQRAYSYRMPNNPVPPIPAAQAIERALQKDITRPGFPSIAPRPGAVGSQNTGAATVRV